MPFQADSKPKLRWPLDIQHVEHEGEKLIVLADQSGIAAEPLVLLEACLPLIGRFDGETTLSGIAEQGKAYGVTVEILLELAGALESKFFLDNEAFRIREKSINQEFANLHVREASHAGLVYPNDASELKKTLDSYVERGVKVSSDNRGSFPVAFIAPHIDYHRGWQTYGAGFSLLADCPAPDIIFLLGTSHQYSEGIFHLTRKHFQTPLGLVNTDVEVVDKLASLFGDKRSFAGEMLHKKEHSLELQVPFIANLYSGDKAPKIIPVLVGSFHDYLCKGALPEEQGEAADFIGALSEVCRELRSSGKKVQFYGGVDMAHVGMHFGDTTRISDGGLEEIETRDKEFLECVLSADEKALFEHIAEDMDKRRICGFPSIYTMLSSMKKAGIQHKGELIEYRQAVDAKSDCIVTFASAAWFEC